MSFLVFTKAPYVLVEAPVVSVKTNKNQASTTMNMTVKCTSIYPFCFHVASPKSQWGRYIVKNSYIFSTKFGLCYMDAPELYYQ